MEAAWQQQVVGGRMEEPPDTTDMVAVGVPPGGVEKGN